VHVDVTGGQLAEDGVDTAHHVQQAGDRGGVVAYDRERGRFKTFTAKAVVLATGGTIAGAAASDVQAAYTSGQVGVEQLLAAVPQAKKLANMRGEQISNIGSQDMNDEVWIKLATRINELAAMPDVAGIVITHGTDTIEETAYFLNLVVKTKKPVVLTAAMRPSTALSADGPLNFYNAVGVAADKKAVNRGVMVVVNDWIHGASSLTKTSTTAVQTFMSPLSGLLGTVAYGIPEWFRGPVGKNTTSSDFSIDKNTVLPRVDVIMATENMDGVLIDAAVAAGDLAGIELDVALAMPAEQEDGLVERDARAVG